MGICIAFRLLVSYVVIECHTVIFNHMLEKELRGEIDSDTFTQKCAEFTKKYGQPDHYRRLSLLAIDLDTPVDSRVRITNGQCEIMQKCRVGKSRDMSEKIEISIPIAADPTTVFNAYQILINQLSTYQPERLLTITAETENHIWEVSDCEVKMSHLYGNGNFYNFEIEARAPESDIVAVAENLDLVDILDFSSPESKKRRKALAHNLSIMPKKALLNLISSYL